MFLPLLTTVGAEAAVAFEYLVYTMGPLAPHVFISCQPEQMTLGAESPSLRFLASESGQFNQPEYTPTL